MGFPGSSDGKESACNAGIPCSILGLGRSPGKGNGNPLQYFCLENPADRGAWWASSPWGHRGSDMTESKSIYDDSMFNIFGALRWFSKVATLFYISSSNIWGLLFSHVLTITCLAFKMLFILVDMQWCHIMILICVSHPLQHSCLENPMDGGAW